MGLGSRFSLTIAATSPALASASLSRVRLTEYVSAPKNARPPMINAMPTPASPMIIRRPRRLIVQKRFTW
jgi:hypothetical protein